MITAISTEVWEEVEEVLLKHNIPHKRQIVGNEDGFTLFVEVSLLTISERKED